MSSYGKMTDVVIGYSTYQVDGVSMAEEFIMLEHVNSRKTTAVGSRPVLIMTHGYTDDYGFITSEGKAQPIVDSLIQSAQPWLIMSISAGGTSTWGNDTSIARIKSAHDFLENMGFASANIYGLGVSMGNLGLMNAQLEHNLFTRTAGIIPIISTSDIRDGNIQSAQSAIDTAYGGTYVTATERAAHDPSYYLDTGGSDLGCPWLGFYAPSDEWEAAANYTGLASASSNVQVHDLGNAYSHGWDAAKSVTAAMLNTWFIDGTVPA